MDTSSPIPLSVRRAAAYVEEARQERARLGTTADYNWDFALAIRACTRYARPRLAKMQRAQSRRWERLGYQQRLLNPPPPFVAWQPVNWPRDPTAPKPSPGWSTLTWKDIDSARHLRETDDEVSPIVITRPLPAEVNYLYDTYLL
ncbi:hypothetical protein B0H11DRAFT_2248634 [Mycena galericulata]|nr:hypothetical protein B0H11DRAFT_2259954 [Mycena galericulata]KAJ7446865.1 hypothetical protein B0H11DRAFT_2248634 [Mycena galericulata]